MTGLRFSWSDNLRVIATMSMVLLHVVSPLVLKFGKVDDELWHIANLIDSSLRFCVPVFVMLSGALLLNHETPIRIFLKKRVMRVVLPFVFYSAVYMAYDRFRHPRSATSTFTSFQYIWDKLAHGAVYHLWYIYMIIGLYLFIPIIGRWVRACTRKELLYFLIIWVVTLVVSHPMLFLLKPDLNLSYFSGFLGYLVLGYYLSLIKFSTAWKKSYSFALLLTGIGITYLGTFKYSLDKGSFDGLFYRYLTPNVLLSSAGLFMLVGNFKFRWQLPEFLRQFICRYSFGIYLVHVLVLSELSRLGINCSYKHPAIGIPVTTIACLAISGLLVALLNRLPGGKYVSG